MFSSLFNKKTIHNKDDARDFKIRESQELLLCAATAAADAANMVTTHIRSKLKDAINQIDSTSRILNDALVICDNNGKIQYTNEVATEMFGKNIIGSDISEYLYCPTCELSGHVLDLLASTDQAETNNELYGLRNTTEFPLDINHTRLDLSDGSSIVLMVMRDMTPNVDYCYKCIFESSEDGIIIVKNNQIVASNPTASKLFGYSKNQLTKKTINEVFIGNTIDLICDIDNAHEIEGETFHKNGNIMTAFFTSTPIAWFGESATLITIKNVHEIVSSDEKLICCFGNDFIITFANNAFCKYYNNMNIIGTDIRTLIDENERDSFIIHLNGLNKRHPTRKMRFFSTKNGENIVQEWTDHAEFLNDGKIEYQRIGSVI